MFSWQKVVAKYLNLIVLQVFYVQIHIGVCVGGEKEKHLGILCNAVLHKDL